jgi:hypothetical protein
MFPSARIGFERRGEMENYNYFLSSPLGLAGSALTDEPKAETISSQRRWLETRAGDLVPKASIPR